MPAAKMQETRPCASCGEDYIGYETSKYCGRECAGAGRRKPPTPCPACGKETRRNKCCSISCSNKMRTKPPKLCKECGNSVRTRQSSYCPVCQERRKKPAPRCKVCDAVVQERRNQYCSSWCRSKAISAFNAARPRAKWRRGIPPERLAWEALRYKRCLELLWEHGYGQIKTVIEVLDKELPEIEVEHRAS